MISDLQCVLGHTEQFGDQAVAGCVVERLEPYRGASARTGDLAPVRTQFEEFGPANAEEQNRDVPDVTHDVLD
jgi:hypothetical protein